MTSKLDMAGRLLLAEFLQKWDIHILSFNDAHWRAAQTAFVRFGKGQGDPAQLNFGDCLTYAVAWVEGEPLLCVGNDFAQTDLELVPLTES